jgi:hypothetical protein
LPRREAGKARTRLRPGAGRRPGTVGSERYTKNLEGEQSPWKERAASRRQRWLQATDSSSEKSPEVGLSVKNLTGPRPIASASATQSPRQPPGFGWEALHTAPSGVVGWPRWTEGGRQPRRWFGLGTQRRFGVGKVWRPCASVQIRFGGSRLSCSVTWGSASADRSIIESDSSSCVSCPALFGAPRRDPLVALGWHGSRKRSSLRRRPCSGQEGNDKRATAVVRRCGCRRGEAFEGCEPRRGDCWSVVPRRSTASGWCQALARPVRNAANSMTDCGVQQTRDLRAEEAVEVGRNHEDGT